MPLNQIYSKFTLIFQHRSFYIIVDIIYMKFIFIRYVHYCYFSVYFAAVIVLCEANVGFNKIKFYIYVLYIFSVYICS